MTRQEWGHILGRRNVRSGHLARIRKLPQTLAAKKANGIVVGRMAVESGMWPRIQRLGSAANQKPCFVFPKGQPEKGRRFKSAASAARALKLTKSGLMPVLRQSKRCTKGYTGFYIEEAR